MKSQKNKTGPINGNDKYSPIIPCSLMVGMLTGLIGSIFQIGLRVVENWRLHLCSVAAALHIPGWLTAILLSALMVSASFWLVRKFAPETGGSGVQEMEGALAGLRPVRWKRVIPVKFLGGILALGAGMALGREGPTIQMGGNLGKMIGDLFKDKREQIHALIAAGSGAGLAAAFNAPLAGMIFVIEEMHEEFNYNFYTIIAVSSAVFSSTVITQILLGQGPSILMPEYQLPPLESLWFFMILGMLVGLIGYSFNKALIKLLNFFSAMQRFPFLLVGLTVGALIGALGWFFPDIVGGGYKVIPKALKCCVVGNNSMPMTMLIIIFLLRFGTTVFCYGSGAPGGIFAPMMALGTLFGLWFGHFGQGMFPHLISQPGVFAVAAMGALFAATVRAPITGIVLIVEMTRNYELILPLIITCTAAVKVAYLLGGRPIYTVLLERTLNLSRHL